MHKPNKTRPISQQHHKANIKARNSQNIKSKSFKFISEQTIEYIIDIDSVRYGKLGGIFVQIESYVIRSNVVTWDC